MAPTDTGNEGQHYDREFLFGRELVRRMGFSNPQHADVDQVSLDSASGSAGEVERGIWIIQEQEKAIPHLVANGASGFGIAHLEMAGT
jgi:hypothetical protein